MQYSNSRYIAEIQKGHRRFIAKAITLLESTLPEHAQQGHEILEALMPQTGSSIRLGITGVPGVGKSTFIEALGLHLIEKGHRIAVLPIDPSSPISGGSLMGDKTRMSQLAVHPSAFIRPSPSQGILGGVARKTKEALLLCEAAGHDIIFVETVGVGQSETTVASLVDCFLVLMLPNAGDELQGIKKGILELADLVVIHKADGENFHAAQNAAQAYARALDWVRAPKNSWSPQVLTCSALQNQGLEELWACVLNYQTALQASGEWEQQRQSQAKNWMWTLIEDELLDRFRTHPLIQKMLLPLEQSVAQGRHPPSVAAQKLLDAWFASQ